MSGVHVWFWVNVPLMPNPLNTLPEAVLLLWVKSTGANMNAALLPLFVKVFSVSVRVPPRARIPSSPAVSMVEDETLNIPEEIPKFLTRPWLTRPEVNVRFPPWTMILDCGGEPPTKLPPKNTSVWVRVEEEPAPKKMVPQSPAAGNVEVPSLLVSPPTSSLNEVKITVLVGVP